ncbi:MAG: hypothetical protein U0175_14085 [Caldilineaceae bacterium]
MQSPLIGAWKFYIEGADGWQGMWVFSESHYAGIFEQNNRKLGIQGDKHTEAEEAYGYRTLGCGGGHYTIEGNVFTLSETYDRLLDGHRPVQWEFKLEGTLLHLKDLASGWSTTLTKLS